MTTVAINGKALVRCTNHSDARNWASRIYVAYADIVVEGATNDKLAEDAIKANVIPGEDFLITVSGRDWREFIAKEDWIENRI